MKKQLIICDRCQKEFTYPIISNYIIKHSSGEGIDLCEECAKDMNKFMHEKMPVPAVDFDGEGKCSTCKHDFDDACESCEWDSVKEMNTNWEQRMLEEK